MLQLGGRGTAASQGGAGWSGCSREDCSSSTFCLKFNVAAGPWYSYSWAGAGGSLKLSLSTQNSSFTLFLLSFLFHLFFYFFLALFLFCLFFASLGLKNQEMLCLLWLWAVIWLQFERRTDISSYIPDAELFMIYKVYLIPNKDSV